MTAPVISKSAVAPKANARTRPADLSVGIRATFPLGRSTKLLPNMWHPALTGRVWPGMPENPATRYWRSVKKGLDPGPGLGEDAAQDLLHLGEVLGAAGERRRQLDDGVAAVVGAADQAGVEQGLG